MQRLNHLARSDVSFNNDEFGVLMEPRLRPVDNCMPEIESAIASIKALSRTTFIERELAEASDTKVLSVCFIRITTLITDNHHPRYVKRIRLASQIVARTRECENRILGEKKRETV